MPLRHRGPQGHRLWRGLQCTWGFIDLRGACGGVLKVQNAQKQIDELVEFI